MMKSLIYGLRALFRKRATEREMDEELRGFLDASTEDKVRSGMTGDEAARAARVEMGSANSVKHRVRSSGWEISLDDLFRDLRYGLRALLRSPGFAMVAVASLALGIGANTAIFTVLNAVLLRPLPVRAPNELLLFGGGQVVGSTSGLPSDKWELFSYPFYREFAAKTDVFSGVAAVLSIQMGSHIAVRGGGIEPVRIDLVSGSYFNVLGVPPIAGRVIAEADDRAAGAGPVAVVSYGWFQRHLQGDPNALGETIRIQGHDYTIIGVARPGFTGLAPASPADLWIPLSMQKEVSPGWNGFDDFDFRSLYLFGRVKPGVALARAGAATNLLSQQIARSEYNPSESDLADLQHASIELTPVGKGLPKLRQRYSAPLEILMGIVVLVLLIACANIANTLFARGVTRSREIAVRQALGATRSRIVVQLLTESFLLAAAGAALGIFLASRGVHWLLALASGGPKAIPLDLAPDYRVLGFTLGITVLTALFFGVAPALRAARLEISPALKEGSRNAAGPARRTLSRSLIVGQIALSVLLLSAAALFVGSLRNLTRVDLGFDPSNVTVFTLDEYAANLPLDERLTRLQQQIEESVRALPGVQSASFSMFTFNQGEWSNPIVMQGFPSTPGEGREEVFYNVIGNDYLRTFRIPLFAGRNFNAQDTEKSPHVAIVNETLARRFFPGGSALGHHFCLCEKASGLDPKQTFDIEIVGVVRDARYVSPGDQQQMAAYFPYSQRIQYFGNFAVRSGESPAALIPEVRRALAQVNPNIAIWQVEPLAEQVRGSMATQRLIGVLSAFFACLAVFLAAIGVYGLVSYSAARRTSEIGIRLALGAQSGSVLWLIFRESLLLLVIGLAIGLPMSFGIDAGLAPFLKRQLFHVDVFDPVALAIAVIVIAAMTSLASWIPARRAAKVDPMVALRCE